MPRVGQARRRDASETPIVKALRAVGALVVKHGGKGEPDVFVLYRGAWTAAEIKTGKGTLTTAQKASGTGRSWQIWRTPADALYGIGLNTL